MVVLVTAWQTLMMWRRPGIRGGYYVDGTTGDGGHALALLESDPSVKLMCIDRDTKVRGNARYS